MFPISAAARANAALADEARSLLSRRAALHDPVTGGRRAALDDYADASGTRGRPAWAQRDAELTSQLCQLLPDPFGREPVLVRIVNPHGANLAGVTYNAGDVVLVAAKDADLLLLNAADVAALEPESRDADWITPAHQLQLQ